MTGRSSLDPLVHALDHSAGRGLTRGWKAMILIAVLLGALSFAGSAALFVIVSNEGRATQESLCALRAEIERRVKQGETFQREHPQGAFGFTPEEIEKGIRDQRRTITALSGLNCK